uniref:Uncharacterized protein n=1 Tax=Vombatus ursinus TaxID=29139 RepID=A0A4X2L3V8_VOMUR
MVDLAKEEKPAITPPIFVFKKGKGQKKASNSTISCWIGEDANYWPPVKQERTSSLTQFPPSQSVSKNSFYTISLL